MRRLVGVGYVFALFAIQGLFSTRSAAVQLVNPQVVQFTEDAFDRSNFNRLTEVAARKQCEDSLQATIDMVKKAAAVDEAEIDKLQLAGQIDIHRFFASYQDAKRTIQFGSLPRDQWQAQITRLQTETRPLLMRYAGGLHGKSSLLRKTIASALDAEQRENVEAMFRERERTTYANHIRVTISVIDGTVPLTEAQRSTIMRLLLAKTEPPESYGTSRMTLLIVLNQMAQIRDELRESFSEKEWNVIERIIQAGAVAMK